MTEKKLDLTTPDSRGYVPDLKLIGTRWKHTGNGKVYTIRQFIWNGEDDTWMLSYWRRVEIADPNDPRLVCNEFTRSPANFFGKRMVDGVPTMRFTLVE